MLLLDGEPFKLDDVATAEFAKNYTYMIPRSKVSRNRVTGVIEIAQGVGITAEYRFINNRSKKECRLRYYEYSHWDDTLRKEVYFPENIMIGDTGLLHVGRTQAELNYFLNNHPGLEGGDSRKDYPRYPILFRLKNKPKDSMVAMERYNIRKEMEQYIDPENPKAWKFDRLLSCCQALANDTEFASIPQGLQLPSEVLNYREIEAMDKEERKEYEVVLRVALLKVISDFPEYAKDRLLVSLDREWLTIINRASQTEFTNFRFDPQTSSWVEFENNKWLTVLKCKSNENPHNRLMKEMKADPKLQAKIQGFADKVGASV